jgi:ABC-type nitrate/sulfonate/bicarbonate transport system permease component
LTTASPAPQSKPVPPAPAQAGEKSPGEPAPPPWWKTLRADPPFVLRIAIGAGFVGLILLLWWLATRGAPTEAWISPSKLPSPGKVFGSLDKLLERDLQDSIFATMTRVLKGVLYAAIFGIGIGVLVASFRGGLAAVTPIVIFLRSVPMGALLPLTVVWFSTGEKQKAMFIFLAVVPFVFSDTVKAMSSVPERYVETAQTLGASRFQIIRKVLFPLALPDIITSLRFQFGLALGYITLAEAINTERGIGAMLNNGEKRGLIEQNFLLLFIIASIAFLIDWGIRGFQRGVFPYRKDL